MAEDTLSAVYNRNRYYRQGQRKVVSVLLVSMGVNLLLSVLLVFMIMHPPEPKYFATSIDGHIMPLYPLSQPNQSDTAVVRWANQAAIAAFTYNFVNWHAEIEAASGFFTAEGWTAFLNSLKQSNNIAAVTAKKLVVTAVATGSPVILQKGILNGRYSWRIQLPLLVTFQSASEFAQQNNVITMLITRVDPLNSPRGIGIAQFVASPATGGVGGS
jgi:intracellular multiplication protein IcmL